MRAFLTLYLRSKLNFTDEEATEIYHVFSTFCYFFPILGGILADNYLGKFRTILYLMFIYAVGNMLVAVTAIPVLDMPKRLWTVIGLFLITVGTGGIKPCVTSFGGDQFLLPRQEKQLALYFSILYFNICTGSLIAKTISPILRSEVHCFGDKDCYSLAFGAPGLVVLMSIVIFVSAKNSYVMKKPEGNTLFDFVKCVSLGIKNLVTKKRNEEQSHWLDSTQPKYDKRFIKDVKKTLSILMLFTVLPVFWALLDQLGSRWTLQATKMDGRLGFITIKPDQLQVFAPICILILIPLSQKTTYPELPQSGFSQLRIFNGNPCSISIHNDQQNIIYTIPSLSHYTNKHIRVKEIEELQFSIGGNCIEPTNEVFTLKENKAMSFYINGINVFRFEENVDKSKSGLPVVRFLPSHRVNTSEIYLFNEKRKEAELYINDKYQQTEVFMSVYSIRVNDSVIASDIEMNNGGVYTVVIDNTGGDYRTKVITITEPNSITMALLLPQFLIISTAEVLFAVTGNEFAFKEAPESMKAVMSAVWLMTEAAGNVIIIVVTRIFINYKQETQSFIYTGMMFVSVAIFHFMSKRYQFGDAAEAKKECRSNSEVLYQQVRQAEECLEH
ncbi:unnamed protein product, partial [Brenthis ino]